MPCHLYIQVVFQCVQPTRPARVEVKKQCKFTHKRQHGNKYNCNTEGKKIISVLSAITDLAALRASAGIRFRTRGALTLNR